MLKRHLRTVYGLSPEEYRSKWGLPADYPMVAPNYSKKRSAFAKKIGLGRSEAAHNKSGHHLLRRNRRHAGFFFLEFGTILSIKILRHILIH